MITGGLPPGDSRIIWARDHGGEGRAVVAEDRDVHGLSVLVRLGGVVAKELRDKSPDLTHQTRSGRSTHPNEDHRKAHTAVSIVTALHFCDRGAPSTATHRLQCVWLVSSTATDGSFDR